MQRADVIIVGGGLAGLACALELQAAGVDYLLIEAADSVGGRGRTDDVEGYRLDRGFQVLLKNYPEANAVLDFDALDLHPFESGVLIRYDGAFHEVADPWRAPISALRGLTAPIGTLTDKMRVGALRKRALSYLSDGRFSEDGTAADVLVSMGFTDAMVNRFFRPFLGGVFLDRDLIVPAEMLYFVFGHFALGGAAVPSSGMQAIPDQMVARLDDHRVLTDTPVSRVEDGQVMSQKGEGFQADHIVMATDLNGLSALNRSRPGVPDWRGVTCLYFLADKDPVGRPTLVLNGDGEDPINNLCVPTTVSPAYGPDDKALISVTVLGIADEEILAQVAGQLVSWYGPDAVGWRLLKAYYLPHALPPARSAGPPQNPLVCGDHTTHASIEGALLSGKRSAQHLLSL